MCEALAGAKWIWSSEVDVKGYNTAVQFEREFELASCTSASVAISADSWYRLKINGEWVNDGPCRNFPNHYQYDVMDVSRLLRPGTNRVEVLVRFFGIGTAHQIPQQAGFLAMLSITTAGNEVIRIGSDATWAARQCFALIQNTARLSIKQEPAEVYDNRLGFGSAHEVTELYDIELAPWKNLHPRDVALLTKDPVNFVGFLHHARVTSDVWSFSIPAQRIVHPGLYTTNFSTSLSCGVAFRVLAREGMSYKAFYENLDVFLNGVLINPKLDLCGSQQITFPEGESLLVMMPKYPFENQTDLSLAIVNPAGLTFENPHTSNADTVCFISFPESFWESCEIPRHMWANEELLRRQQDASRLQLEVGRCSDWHALFEHARERIHDLPWTEFSDDEAHWAFRAREVEILASGAVLQPENLIYDNAEWAEISPDAGAEQELLFDLGEQQCGYWEIELLAHAGLIVDISSVEYINEQNVVQHTDDVRNGFRYVCTEGLNKFVSTKRRSGRFAFITFRDIKERFRVRLIRLISSTYPVKRSGNFHCSSSSLNEIWDISARTIKLCMEDVFTDCPCYEQSLWLGDGRNIALFSYPLYGPWDLGRRCIRLGGYSLDNYPIAGSQVPSGWDCLIPAWSFLWGLSAWDYFEETADLDFLEEVFPMLEKNVDGAWMHIDAESGLFEMYTWNLFEWVETDTHQPRMIYDSMLLSAAIESAMKCAQVLGYTEKASGLKSRRECLNLAINATWDEGMRAYPDSLRKPTDYRPPSLPPNLAPVQVGEKHFGPCRDFSVHTSMLSILYSIANDRVREQAAENTLSTRENMIQVRNMFAKFYLYQTLEKLGEASRIMPLLTRDYAPMLERDSTTTWENFMPYGDGFPCRSHAHAWSAGALHFIYRLVLGLKMKSPGAREFYLSPEAGDLRFAEGTRSTVNGPLWVRWERADDELRINFRAPIGVTVEFRSNPSLSGLRVIVNGEECGDYCHSV